MRPLLIQAVAFGSLALLLARVKWSLEGLRSFLTAGPNLAVILFLGWTSLSFALMAPGGGRGRAIALAELMRLASGVAIYFAVMYRCNSRDHLKLAVLLLLVGGVLASAAGMLSAGISKFDGVTAVYGNRQLLAAFLVLLLPAAIVFAQTGEKFSRPLLATSAALRCLLATVATVMLVAAILLTNNRSSWLGSVVGLIVTTALLLRARRPKEGTTRKHHWIASPIVASASLVLFLILVGAESGVIERAKTLTAPTRVISFQQRLQLWSICARMIRTRPLMGFGVGSFPMKADDYSGAIADLKDESTVIASGAEMIGVPSAAQVEKEGASLSSLPHNEYLQLAAEQGLVGLALYIAVLVGFFYRGIKALPHIARLSRTRKLLLIAAMGAVAAQCVDAFGNPGWHFGDVSPLLWLVLGIGMAAARTHEEPGLADEEDPILVRRLLRYQLRRLSWQAMPVVLGLALMVLFFVGTVSARGGWMFALYNPKGHCDPPPTCSRGQHLESTWPKCECVPDDGGSQCTVVKVEADVEVVCLRTEVIFAAETDPPNQPVTWSGDMGPAPFIYQNTLRTHYDSEGPQTVTATCGSSKTKTVTAVKVEIGGSQEAFKNKYVDRDDPTKTFTDAKD